MRVGGQTLARVATLINCHPRLTGSMEIINNTRAGIVIFFQSKKGNALLGGKFKFRML